MSFSKTPLETKYDSKKKSPNGMDSVHQIKENSIFNAEIIKIQVNGFEWPDNSVDSEAESHVHQPGQILTQLSKAVETNPNYR